MASFGSSYPTFGGTRSAGPYQPPKSAGPQRVDPKAGPGFDSSHQQPVRPGGRDPRFDPALNIGGVGNGPIDPRYLDSSHQTPVYPGDPRLGGTGPITANPQPIGGIKTAPVNGGTPLPVTPPAAAAAPPADPMRDQWDAFFKFYQQQQEMQKNPFWSMFGGGGGGGWGGDGGWGGGGGYNQYGRGGGGGGGMMQMMMPFLMQLFQNKTPSSPPNQGPGGSANVHQKPVVRGGL